MSMDMPAVIVMLGVLLVLLVALPLVATVMLAGREGRGHHSRKEVAQVKMEAQVAAQARAIES